MGFDFFMLTAAPQHLMWRFMTNLSHHLIVLCTDSNLEMIGYSICWSVHLFCYAKYIGGYEKLVPVWKLGNHIPVFILLQYGYYYYVDTQPVNELCFFVCVQMVLYRYIFITAAHAPYGLMKIEPFQTYIKQTTKGMNFVLSQHCAASCSLWNNTCSNCHLSSLLWSPIIKGLVILISPFRDPLNL